MTGTEKLQEFGRLWHLKTPAEKSLYKTEAAKLNSRPDEALAGEELQLHQKSLVKQTYKQVHYSNIFYFESCDI